MKVLICTYKRPDRQTTWASLPPSVQARTQLVVQHREREAYTGLPTLVLPPEIQNLPDTRQWLQDNLEDSKCVQLDDDLVFAYRRDDDPTKFTACKAENVEAMFSHIEQELDHYAHVGVSGREGANRKTEYTLEVGRQMRIHGYRLDIMRDEGIVLNSMPDVEDFHTTLQLLRKGYPNLILNWIVHNQGGSNTAGGVSEYRTLETHARDVELLAEHHPEFVKVVTKKTKQAWGGQERKDVVIQWKRAYASADTNPHVGPPDG